MHTFIIKCEGETISAQYLKKEEAKALAEHVNELQLKEYHSLNPISRQKLENKEHPLLVLNTLAKKHPTNFFVHYTLGNLLQDMQQYLDSIDSFTNAYHYANHAALKFNTKYREALSWKQLGDATAHTGERHLHLGQTVPATRHSNQAHEFYANTQVAYEETRQWHYAALPAEAIAFEFNHCSYYLSLAKCCLDFRHIKPHIGNTATVTPFINRAKAHKELSVQLSKYYTIQDFESDQKAFDEDVKNLEICMRTLLQK